MPKLSIVIVSYNVKYYVAQCITSVLRSQGGVDADITVVDNHSQDGTVEFLRKRFPSVKVVASNHNLGFARANNIAIKATTGEYVLLLNPDTIVGEDVLSWTPILTVAVSASGCSTSMVRWPWSHAAVCPPP